ncbi:MAG: hypothetical protein GY859_07400 [Desulfobacterales bacterium]|nr:hypothetical protein [Desulfobacterales bacterium]
MRPRAVALGLILAVVVCAVTPFNNTYLRATPLGGGHFPLAPFFALMLLTLLAAAAGRLFRGKPWLTGGELLVVWILMVLVSGIAYTGLVRTFFINLTAPHHFATVENRWEEVLHPLLPADWYPRGKEAVEGVYNGLAGGRDMGWMEILRHIPWGAWLRPIISWGGFITLCYMVMICTVNLLSRQWIQNERMNFPLLRVPQLMAEAFDENRLGKFIFNKFLLTGLLLTVFLHLVNGLHFYYPSTPQIPTLILAGPYFPKVGMFAGFHKLKIYIYPAFIGFAFLTTRQISVSFWLFYILGALLIGLLSALGYTIPPASLGVMFGPTLSRPEEMQMIGAYGVFFLFILWLARFHLRDAVQQAFFLRKTDTRASEWFSMRLSFWGVILGGFGIAWWCSSLGMNFWIAILLVGAFFMIMLVASRIICQGGIAYFTLTAAPTDGLLAIFGPRCFGGVGLLIAGVVQKVLFVDLRESLMPSLFHAGKVSRRTGAGGLLFGAILAALIIGVVVSFLAMLSLCYKYGARELGLDWATRTTVTVYENVQRLVEAPAEPGKWVAIFSAAGAVVMLALTACYHRFYWWPLHPIGYLTAYSSAMRILWFSFFVGWMCNALCMRYGGVDLFRRLRLFFIGLIIGDFLMGGAWAIVGMFSDSSYLVLPD